MRVLNAAEMREIDRLTTERFGVPGIKLMENAAASVVRAIGERLGPFSGKQVLVFCGKGNNGGDGAAIARLLHNGGARVSVLLIGSVTDTGGDARTNFDKARALAASAPDSFSLSEIQTEAQLNTEAGRLSPAICIDALFGTGLARPAAGLYEAAIDLVNRLRPGIPVVSVDIPSGIPSDSGELIGSAVQADLTVTFTAPKIGNILPPASNLNGELVIASIGSPDELIAASGSRLTFVEPPMIQSWLEASRREPDSNKGDAGKVLVVAGSRGKTGAACLAGEAALRAGAGLVTIATARSAQPVVAARAIPECMTEPLEETSGGCISSEALEYALELSEARDVIAVGPGLGSTEPSTREFVRTLVEGRQRPTVLDADALNALAPWPDGLMGSRSLPLILTPHPGEMARLVAEKSIAEVLRYRLEIAREFATTHRVVLVVKGQRTLIASWDGEIYVNPTGNPGLATGGTGDVLTGIIAGLLAQALHDPLGAAIAAVYLHGLAGDIAAARLGTRAMIASDVIASLGQAFIEAGGSRERLQR
ncbi:MAG TPA: NAD(P)H-hydrate dehydratase [Blastocatellia bacterium]|nr:NAD(P)H-hydrate dehydratase [Blastocatellia bacterium]